MRTQSASPANTRLTFIEGLAVTRSGEIFAQFRQFVAGSDFQEYYFGLFRLNRFTARWEQVGEIGAEAVPGRLVGSKDDTLVFLRRDGAGAWMLEFVPAPSH